MRKIRNFLESAVAAVEPYSRMAERDAGEVVSCISNNIPGVVKVYALTWWGFVLAHTGAIASLLFSSWLIALVCGKGTLPAAWFAVNLIAFVAVYNIVFLCRWDEEGWWICEVCRAAVPDGTFCQNCGTPLVLQKRK